MKVEEKMTKTLAFVDVSATAEEAAKKMQSEKVGTVLVSDNEMLGVLKGLVTDRQIVTKVVAAGKNPSEVKVADFMTKDPATISPDADIHEAGKIMGEYGYRRLPVVQEGEPVGIISIADLAEHAKTCNLCTQNIMNELQRP
ncbi:CBS domain-containing protein [Methanotrichaceae archaeon M04Ac]|jgi:CBS domain-containing protein|uniref:CBS domain-containing protein n=1 Tax=Candidatus Methanocrinis alkalitolerans TaxID=3033395 RepID=A0ABT5XHZ7_9EURY|nr:CBS domain-containing protein [Candidatus Methanocrinis alkalitolerans]MCR3884862.1 CBS domain-containing protein [Methanothrix sp.]MDF0594344.1 CBS domain-containing protein [Candidatus Methanocrinis alkalitolerans]